MTPKHQPGSEHIAGWPKESRESAQLVIDRYGDPDVRVLSDRDLEEASREGGRAAAARAT